VSFRPLYSLAIVLARTNYSESDRILTLLTKDYGKIRAIAKGVRKERSKLAGGIELFTVSQIGFVPGKRELATIVSTRLSEHFTGFLNDLDRVNFAFAAIKIINRITAEAADESYFWLIRDLFAALNDEQISLPIINLWWTVNLSELTGHEINTVCLNNRNKFSVEKLYCFDVTKGGFRMDDTGVIRVDHIKLIRLAQVNSPKALMRVKGITGVVEEINSALNGFVEYHH
jgi:DNA repair protein RecO (recombination protein O)